MFEYYILKNQICFGEAKKSSHFTFITPLYFYNLTYTCYWDTVQIYLCYSVWVFVIVWGYCFKRECLNSKIMTTFTMLILILQLQWTVYSTEKCIFFHSGKENGQWNRERVQSCHYMIASIPRIIVELL